MPKKLSEMTQKECERWARSYYLSEAKKNGLTKEPKQHTIQSLARHDLWSVYDYGDMIKIVYHKALPDRPDPKKDPLWVEDCKRNSPQFTAIQHPEDERFSSSVSRSKAKIFELAMCNEFTHFCTFTQDKDKRDRFDLCDFREDFAMLVRNLNRTRDEESKIKYLLIPEQHKDGAWHMHGFLMGLTDKDLRPFELSEKLPERIREQLENGVKVYDWTRYRRAFGYFTCTEIANHTACAKYITKYISKDLQKTVREAGEHLFFASQGLKRREVVQHLSADPCDINVWDYENQYVKVKEIYKSTVPKMGQ